MAFIKSYITQKGLALIAKLVASEQELTITAAKGGDGIANSSDYSEMEALLQPKVDFSMNNGVEYLSPSEVRIPLYYENSALGERVMLTEIGIYAQDPQDGEILLAIAPSYEEPLPLPTLDEGRLELTTDFRLQLTLSPEVNITLPSSMIYLTREEADGRYWRLRQKYPATEITESTGTTTEEWQRIQDERIKQLEVTLESGTTAGITANKPPSDWKILNNSGYRDRERGTIRAW